MTQRSAIELPDIVNATGRSVLLHSCCAPCSAAVLESFLQSGIRPTVFYSNPNIYPVAEYEHRRNEIRDYLRRLSVPFVEDTCCHEEWLCHVRGMENQPERGLRCLRCFEFRLRRTAIYAKENGFAVMATTLASSRWKSIAQIAEAGHMAEACVDNGVVFLDRNWRKGGLQDRRNALLKENGFYNQQYCGCEFSMRQAQQRNSLRFRTETAAAEQPPSQSP